MIISGTIIPVGVKNKNGWGILDSEIPNVIATLKGKAITVCPRNDDAHACDFDPKAEIGQVSDVWFDPFSKKIRAMAKVTDTKAQDKIKDGTWKPNWSVRLAAKTTAEGWAKDVEGKNITVVPTGAWPEANFNVLASKDGGFEVVLLANFDVAPAPTNPIQSSVVLGTVNFVPMMKNSQNVSTYVEGSTTAGGNIWPSNGTETDYYQWNPLIVTPYVEPQPFVSSPQPKAEDDKKKEDVKGGKQMADEKVNTITVEQHTAALAERDQKIADLEKKVGDLTAGQADAISTKAKEIADAQITAYKASLARDSAIKEYVTAAKERGIKEVDVKMFDGLTAEQIGVFTASLKAIEAPKEDDDMTAAKYPARSTPEENGSLSVGIPEVQADGSVVWKDKF